MKTSLLVVSTHRYFEIIFNFQISEQMWELVIGVLKKPGPGPGIRDWPSILFPIDFWTQKNIFCIKNFRLWTGSPLAKVEKFFFQNRKFFMQKMFFLVLFQFMSPMENGDLWVQWRFMSPICGLRVQWRFIMSPNFFFYYLGSVANIGGADKNISLDSQVSIGLIIFGSRNRLGTKSEQKNNFEN
jgi:hypothetical protein